MTSGQPDPKSEERLTAITFAYKVVAVCISSQDKPETHILNHASKGGMINDYFRDMIVL